MELVGGVSLSHEQIREQLEKNNYFARLGIKDVDKVDANSTAMKDAISAFQEFRGLNVDGYAGSITQIEMQLPRCGLPDFIFEAGNEPAWPTACRTVPTSHRLAPLLALPNDVIHQVWMDALAEITSHSTLTLEFVTEMEEAKIWAHPGTMARGTLAWSYLPDGTCAFRPEQQYNKAIQWTRDLLLDTVVHEVLHAVGLGHGPPGSIMAPTASGSHGGKMKAWDIQALQMLYNPRVVPAPIPPTPTPPLGPDYHPWTVQSPEYKYTGWMRAEIPKPN